MAKTKKTKTSCKIYAAIVWQLVGFPARTIGGSRLDGEEWLAGRVGWSLSSGSGQMPGNANEPTQSHNWPVFFFKYFSKQYSRIVSLKSYSLFVGRSHLAAPQNPSSGIYSVCINSLLAIVKMIISGRNWHRLAFFLKGQDYLFFMNHFLHLHCTVSGNKKYYKENWPNFYKAVPGLGWVGGELWIIAA